MYMSDDDEEDYHNGSLPQPVNIAAPRPGYPATVAALNVKKPAPTAVPDSRKAKAPGPIDISATATPPPIYSATPPHTPGTPGVPSTPHPLQAPLTPIMPAFARPPKAEIKFVSEKPIIRGNSEDLLLPKRGEKGDDFWRRFSMVVKEEQSTRYSRSSWLKKTESGVSRLSTTVWVIGLFLLLVSIQTSTIQMSWHLLTGFPPFFVHSVLEVLLVSAGMCHIKMPAQPRAHLSPSVARLTRLWRPSTPSPPLPAYQGH